MKWVGRRYERAVETMKVTVRGVEEDIWRDVYWLAGLPAIPAGSRVFVHLVKQFEYPDNMTAGIAWLREFRLTLPSGASINLWATPYTSGQYGLNITDPLHYESTQESVIFYAPYDITAGSRVAYRGRASTSTVAGKYLKILDKGCLTVEIDDLENDEAIALAALVADLSHRVAALEQCNLDQRVTDLETEVLMCCGSEPVREEATRSVPKGGPSTPVVGDKWVTLPYTVQPDDVGIRLEPLEPAAAFDRPEHSS